SPDFIYSEYCYGVEMKRALERHERGEARVILVILRPVYWQEAPFGKLQVLPTDAKPVTSSSWHDLDEAFFAVVQEFSRVIYKHLHAPIYPLSRVPSGPIDPFGHYLHALYQDIMSYLEKTSF